MKNTVTFIVGLVVSALTARLAGVEFLSDNPEYMNAAVAALTAVFGFLGSLFVKWVSGREQWEKFFRLVAVVVNLVRVEASAGARDSDLRSRAIEIILANLSNSQVGWRASIFKVPGIGKYLLGIVLDWLVSGYKRLSIAPPDLTITAADSEVQKALLRNQKPA